MASTNRNGCSSFLCVLPSVHPLFVSSVALSQQPVRFFHFDKPNTIIKRIKNNKRCSCFCYWLADWLPTYNKEILLPTRRAFFFNYISASLWPPLLGLCLLSSLGHSLFTASFAYFLYYQQRYLVARGCEELLSTLAALLSRWPFASAFPLCQSNAKKQERWTNSTTAAAARNSICSKVQTKINRNDSSLIFT